MGDAGITGLRGSAGIQAGSYSSPEYVRQQREIEKVTTDLDGIESELV
ncbi:MAG: hypothetical protein H6765_06150 [Candidatus Peribacteria bacterium]|nr:MAG: hypothetical protein H6765_06150 [Candidatus Peribacteria bacterium]